MLQAARPAEFIRVWAVIGSSDSGVSVAGVGEDGVGGVEEGGAVQIL